MRPTSFASAALLALELFGAAVVLRLGWEVGGRLWVAFHWVAFH